MKGLRTPYFSIIIPTYNRGLLIKSTIDSALDQSFNNYEVIVVDDGSTDDTAEIIQQISDPKLKYFKKDNAERAAARNYGVCVAQGEYLTFLDSDDLLKTNHLEVAFDYIKKNSEPPIFHLGYDVILPDRTILYKWKELPDPANRKLLEGNFLSCLGVFGQRDIFREHKFNEYRPISGSGEDYELWLRLAARYPIRTCPTVTALLVHHEDRGVLTFDSKRLLMHSKLLREAWSRDAVLMKVFEKELSKLYAYLDLYVALHLTITGNKLLGFRELIAAFRRFPLIALNYRFWVIVLKFFSA